MSLPPPPLGAWYETEYHLADWTIVLNGEKIFYVNSMALVSNSSAFHHAFTSLKPLTKEKVRSRTMKVSYADEDSFKEMLDFIQRIARSSELLSDSDLADLLDLDSLASRLRVAMHFGVPRLMDAILSAAVRFLTHSTCWDVMRIAASAESKCPLLETIAMEYALAHFHEAVRLAQSQFVSNVSFEQLHDLLRSDYLNAPELDELKGYVNDWIEADESNRLVHYGTLWDCVLKTRKPYEAVFIVGGRGWTVNDNDQVSGSQRLLNWVHIYTPCNQTVTKYTTFLPAMNAARFHHVCVHLQGFVYVIGGVVVRRKPPGHEVTADVQAYDLQRRLWRQLTPLTTPRTYACGCVCAERIFVIGGFSGKYILLTAEWLDPRNNHWGRTSRMRVARTQAGAAALRGLVYVCGGRQRNSYVSSTERFDPETNQWTLLNANLSIAVAGLALVTLDDRLYAVGGDGNLSSQGDMNLARNLHQYKWRRDQWVPKGRLPNPLSFMSATVVKDAIYIVGGLHLRASNQGFERHPRNKLMCWRPKAPEFSLKIWGLPKHLASLDGHGACAISDCCDLIETLMKGETYE